MVVKTANQSLLCSNTPCAKQSQTQAQTDQPGCNGRSETHTRSTLRDAHSEAHAKLYHRKGVPFPSKYQDGPSGAFILLDLQHHTYFLTVMLSSQECARLVNDGAIAAADSDIAGIGVILAFLISAYMTFAAVLLAYMTGMVENELLSVVDRKLFRIRSRIQRHPRIQVALRKFVLSISDQQIVTGIAIMAAGLRGLAKGTISTYHYQIVLYLAWLSSSVHLSAISLLTPYLSKYQGLRTWRLVGMLALLVMLLVGLVPTLSDNWGTVSDPSGEGVRPTGWGVPAACFWGKTYGNGVNNDAPLGYAILVVSYVWKVGELFVSPQRLYHVVVHIPVRVIMEKPLCFIARRYARKQRKRYLILFRLYLMLCLPLFATLETIISFSAALWLSILGLVFGTLQIVIPRNQNLASTADTEEKWGFGQLVPLILLIQPLGVLTEDLGVRHEKHHAQNMEMESRASRASGSDRPMLLSPKTSDRRTRMPLIGIMGEAYCQTSTASESSDFVTIVGRSRLFAILCGLLQVTILLAASLVFYVDARTIGYVRGGNWPLVTVAIGLYTFFGWFLIATLSPYSRIGRKMSR